MARSYSSAGWVACREDSFRCARRRRKYRDDQCLALKNNRRCYRLTFDKLSLSRGYSRIRFGSTRPQEPAGLHGLCSAVLSPGRIEPPAGALILQRAAKSLTRHDNDATPALVARSDRLGTAKASAALAHAMR